MLSLGGSRTVNLHRWLDTSREKELGPDVQTIGGPKNWAMESFAVAKASAYRVGSPAGCSPNPTPVAMPAA